MLQIVDNVLKLSKQLAHSQWTNFVQSHVDQNKFQMQKLEILEAECATAEN